MPRHPRAVALRPPADAKLEVPPVPMDLSPKFRRQWDDFWKSPVARLTLPSLDTDAVEMLFHLRQERDLLLRRGRKQRLVAGSAGQMVINPLLSHSIAVQREIRAFEDRLGLTPKARLALGALIGDAARNIADANADFEDDTDLGDLLDVDRASG